jgi:tRNA A-37 threonylcarbamoyl transferase component Bud32/TolB-like protein
VTEVLGRLQSALADRYRLERELGQGGMATVYLGEDLKHHRRVAIKVLRPELAASLGAERFLREITTTAQLNHPHILPLLDSGAADGTLFYVMPYVEGESLRDRLLREKQLPLDDALQVAREVADALTYAHSHGVIHRDIKPENILLQSGHAVVADFGIAKAVTAAGGAKLTETGLAVGTPQYMSPEQSAGEGDLDGRSDIYSLGCVLYEMLAGEPPFTGPSAQAVLAKRLSTPAPRVSILRDRVPAGVEAAVDRALARTPADRWPTAADFAAALAHPETLGALSAVRPAGRRWRRRAVQAGAAGAVLVAAAVGLTLLNGMKGPYLDPEAIVVAPFENQVRDTSLAQLGALTSDWVTQVLQGAGAFKVAPTAAVAAAAWTPGSRVQDLAAATGAGTVVTGRVLLQGDSVFMRAELVNGRTGALVRSVPTVAAGIREPLAAVKALAERVAGAAAALLDPDSTGLTYQSRNPTSYAAYRAYAEGGRWVAAGEWERAWKEYERAYALDTTFLRALIQAAAMHGNANDVRSADSLLRFVERRRDQLTRVEQVRLEAASAELAGDYDRETAAFRDLARIATPQSALYVWGYAAVLANRPTEAVYAFTKFYPRYDVLREWAPSSSWLGLAYHLLGRFRDELKAGERGHELFPTAASPVNTELRALAALGREADVFHLLDEARGMVPDPTLSSEFWGGVGPWQPYEAALEFRAHGHPEAYRRAIERALVQVGEADTSSAKAREGRALILYGAERWDDARTAYAALHASAPENVEYAGGLGVSEARLGHRAEAEQLSSRLASMDRPFAYGRSQYWRSRIAAVLGDREGAVSLLRQAIAQGLTCAVRWGFPMESCHRDIDFEPLRGYPPFDALLRPKG